LFYSLTGKLIHSDATSAVVECGGVGFICFVSMNTIRNLPAVNQTVKLYTYLNVREDALTLFGFTQESELEFFKLLISVSGVGPKASLAVLSELTPDRLASCIAMGDFKEITKAQGVGAKTAQRIVMELRDKIGGISHGNSPSFNNISGESVGTNASDTVEVLISLGYAQSEANMTVANLDKNMTAEEMLKAAINLLSNRR